MKLQTPGIRFIFPQRAYSSVAIFATSPILPLLSLPRTIPQHQQLPNCCIPVNQPTNDAGLHPVGDSDPSLLVIMSWITRLSRVPTYESNYGEDDVVGGRKGQSKLPEAANRTMWSSERLGAVACCINLLLKLAEDDDGNAETRNKFVRKTCWPSSSGMVQRRRTRNSLCLLPKAMWPETAVLSIKILKKSMRASGNTALEHFSCCLPLRRNSFEWHTNS